MLRQEEPVVPANQLEEIEEPSGVLIQETPAKVAPDKREEKPKSHFGLNNDGKEKPQNATEKTGKVSCQNDFSSDLHRHISMRKTEECNMCFKKPSYET
jgi:hypothetical protein